MSDHNNGRTDTMIHDAPKPRCETCPCEANGECLKDPVQVVFGADGQVERVIEAHARSGGYCSCHPLYGEWEKQELARRMMDGGTK